MAGIVFSDIESIAVHAYIFDFIKKAPRGTREAGVTQRSEKGDKIAILLSECLTI